MIMNEDSINALGNEIPCATPKPFDPMKERIKYNLDHPFARSLSAVASYEQMKKEHKVADHHIKIVVVGDGAVGKKSLLISYVQKKFPTGYIPTVFDNYVTDVKGPQDENIELALWDTAGQEEYSRLRPLSYTDVDLLMVCYSVDSPTSFRHVKESWFPEVKHFCYDTPIMLVGLKSDLYYSNENKEHLVDPKEADKLADKLGAITHVQCSAKTREHIDEIFQMAISFMLFDPPKRSTESKSSIKEETKRESNPSSKRSFSKIKKIRKNKCIIM